MKSACFALIFICVQAAAPAQIRFEVSVPAGTLPAGERGRMLIALSPRQDPAPISAIGEAERLDARVFGRDVESPGPGGIAVVTTGDEYSPHDPLPCDAERAPMLPAGVYFAQALFLINRDLRGVRGPGNMYSDPVRVPAGENGHDTVRLALTRSLSPDTLPPDTHEIRFIRFSSRLLGAFHHRPIFLRAAVLLPRDFDSEPARRYPLLVSIGGYGDRFDAVARMMAPGSRFRSAWLADSLPRMIRLYLDGRGPYGDPYQVNSANNGPYGDALVSELIPRVEKTYRGVGRPEARFLEGASTGGWVSLALQVMYPDSFNGTWSQSPDGVDFRAFELVNIYEDTNAFVNRHGFERPAARQENGDLLWTMRHEVQMENVLGEGNSYTMSGGQWGAWNAVYGPKGPDGLPLPLWDPHSGIINHAVAEQWKKYDLRLMLEDHWRVLGPKLRGKLHIWVGDADNFFLNNAVHLLDRFLSKADPPAGGWIRYGPLKGHVSMPMSQYAMLEEMEAAYEAAGR